MFLSHHLRDSISKALSQPLTVEALEARQLLDGHGIVAADVDGDGAVGFLDYIEIVQHFGNKVARGHGDIDGDGAVSLGDFDEFTEHFGKQRPTDLKPEEADLLVRPRSNPQAQLEESRFVQTAIELINSLGRGRKADAPRFLNRAGNREAIFYPILQAGTPTGTPPDSPADRVDANAGSAFGGVGSIEIVHPTLGTFMCTGTAISQSHVLTAGHCFDVDADGSVDPGITGTFNLNDGSDFSSTHTVSSINIHPDFSGFANGGNDDLSILELATPVPTSTTIYSVRPGPMAQSEQLELVGYGQSGNGETGFTVTPSFSVKRSGSNEADLFVVDDEGSGVDEVYFFDYDEPTGTNAGFFGSTTLGNDIETTVGAGDSGGPAFVDVDGTKVVAGVNTFNWELPGSTAPVGFFQSVGGGMVMNAYVDWIASISPTSIDSNDAPSFTAGGNVVVLEDAGAQSTSWATDISANNGGQTVNFLLISNSNPSLFEVPPSISPDGTLTFTANANASGTAEISIVLQDDGGTEFNGEDTSTPQTLVIEVLPVNDAPSFSAGADIVREQNVGIQTIAGFASDFDAGPLEDDQSVAEYIVETDSPILFLQGPDVDVNGQLTFTPRRTTSGVANVTIQVRDSGGTANGGVDTSEALPFTITIEPSDPLPVPVDPVDLDFTLAGNVTSVEEAELRFPSFATELGEDIENLVATNDNESLFRSQPRINSSGRLKYVPKPDAFGVATVEVVAIGSNQESEAQTFQITIDPINDAPTISVTGDVSVAQGSGAHRITDFATNFDPGNTFESSQAIRDFFVTNDNPALFDAQPSIAPDGSLGFELADAAGVANVKLVVRDDGGTTNGGLDTSESVEFAIKVVPDLVTPPTAQIRDGRLVIRGSGQQLLGIQAQSESGLLSVESSAAPFDFFLSKASQDVSLGVLGPENAVSLDGEIVTSIGYSGSNPAGDLTVSWGDLFGNSAELEVTMAPPNANAVLRDGRIVVKGAGQQLLGLDFQSRAGLLSNDPSANPFGFFLSETTERVALGALGPSNAVMLDGEIVTPVSYSGANPDGDLVAAWGDLSGKSFDLDLSVEVSDITAQIRNGKIVLEGTGQQILGLDFQSSAGLLSNSNSAAPFGFFLAETPKQVSLGVLGLGNAVTLDGSLVTPVSYSGTNPASDLTASWGDLYGGVHSIEVTNVVVDTPFSGFIDASNYIVLEGSGQEVIGVDFVSPDGLLVPLEPNEEQPFSFALSNTTEHISLGLLGESVVVDGLLRTNVQYFGDIDRLSAHWGDPTGTQNELPMAQGNNAPCANPSLQTLSQCADGLAERDAILARLGLGLGDLDGDGVVGFGDFLVVSDNFAKTGQSYVDGDLDLDGTVGFSDFLLLADKFGTRT